MSDEIYTKEVLDSIQYRKRPLSRLKSLHQEAKELYDEFFPQISNDCQVPFYDTLRGIKRDMLKSVSHNSKSRYHTSPNDTDISSAFTPEKIGIV